MAGNGGGKRLQDETAREKVAGKIWRESRRREKIALGMEKGGKKCAGKGGATKISGRVEGGKKLRELVFPGSRNGGEKKSMQQSTSPRPIRPNRHRRGRLHAHACRQACRPWAWPTKTPYQLRRSRQAPIGFADADKPLSASPKPTPYYSCNCANSAIICEIF